MKKRILSIMLCLAMMLAMIPMTAFAAGSLEFKVVADKTEVQIGDTVNYTVYVGAVTAFNSAQLELDIPEGLAYVANSGAVVDGLVGTLGCQAADWTESLKQFAFYGDGSYTNSEDTALVTFACTVSEGATGSMTIGLKNLVAGDDNWENYDCTVTAGAVTIPAPAPEAVAQIGETGYETLAAAVAAAIDGDTIVVKKDITLAEGISFEGKKITVDLGGKTVTGAEDVWAFELSNAAGLTLTNGTVVTTGEVGVGVWSRGVAGQTEANVIVLDGVTMTSEYYVVHHNGNFYGSDVTIEDATLTSTDGVAVYLSGLSTNGKWPAGKNNKLVIGDGAVITGLTAAEAKRADVEVKEGAKLIATGEASMTTNPAGPCTSGYALALTYSDGGTVDNPYGTVGTVTVTGGEFEGKVGMEVVEDVENKASIAISAGSFSEIVAEEYCAEGFVPVTEKDANGKYTVEVYVPTYVAKIGETGYETLDEALAAAVDGDTIVVLNDAEMSARYNLDGKKLTIDLGGKTITAAADAFYLTNGAELNLTNGTVNAAGYGIWSVGSATEANTINLDDVVLNATEFAVYHNGMKYGADVTIKDSKLTSDSVAVYLAGRATVDASWPEGTKNELVIDNSEIIGTTAVEVKRGDVSVNEGSVLTATGEASVTPNSNGPSTSGYALVLSANAPDGVLGKATGDAVVTGGTFEGKVGIVSNENKDDVSVAISAGSFSEIVAEEYCAEGFVPVTEKDANGKYTVEVYVPVYAAQIGETKYLTLDEALTAAVDGDTIVVLNDAEMSARYNLNGKKLTIDLGGKVVTAAADAFYLTNGAELNLTNGTVNAAGYGIWSVGSATEANTINLDDVVLNATEFAVYHNGMKYGADVTIKDSKLTSDSVAVYLAGRATVDASWPEGTKNELVIDNSEIIGTTAVEVKRGDVSVNEGSVLTATGEASVTPNSSGPCTSGYALAMSANAPDGVLGKATGDAVVTGGTFEGKVGIVSNENKDDVSIAISAGSFSEIVAEEYCAEGFVPVTEKDTNGMYTVEEEASADDDSKPEVERPDRVPAEVKDVIEMIDELPSAKKVTLADEEDIEEAREAYEALSKANQRKVTNYADLVKAEKALAALKAAASEEPTEKPEINNPFVDVADDVYYTDAVLWAVENNITSGTSADTFSPNAICTRAQVVTFLWRAAGSPAPKSTEMPFTDVEAGAYYAAAVQWAVENNITGGTSATTFDPNGECTRGQIVTFLWRAEGYPAAASMNGFADVEADTYYNAPVMWAVANGITNGTSATTFSPADSCTRAQVVTFLYRCMAE